MGLLEQCEQLFKTSNLYEVLGVPKEASDSEVRRGYYKISLQVHPDRAPGDEEATKKFQVQANTVTKITVLLFRNDRSFYAPPMHSFITTVARTDKLNKTSAKSHST